MTTNYCSQCGSLVKPEDLFCPECGQAIHSMSPPVNDNLQTAHAVEAGGTSCDKPAKKPFTEKQIMAVIGLPIVAVLVGWIVVYYGVSNITLDKTTFTIREKSKGTLVVEVKPKRKSKDVVWKSSNTSVATVTNVGSITAVGGGTATITASISNTNKTATCQVKVIAPDVYVAGFVQTDQNRKYGVVWKNGVEYERYGNGTANIEAQEISAYGGGIRVRGYAEVVEEIPMVRYQQNREYYDALSRSYRNFGSDIAMHGYYGPPAVSTHRYSDYRTIYATVSWVNGKAEVLTTGSSKPRKNDSAWDLEFNNDNYYVIGNTVFKNGAKQYDLGGSHARGNAVFVKWPDE